jgi:hypothetical protein
VDVSISTAGSVNECTILDTVRAYDTGGELLGAGFFTIEVLFTQTVYTASEEVLTLDTVTGLVENGYNRGRGGRVRFRNLLQENSAFENVLDVDVLSELGSPIAAPSQAPTTITASPTKEPTVPPTMAPSSVPSLLPSNEPSFAPSLLPSSIPSASPSTTSPSPEPSLVPTESPSQAPSVNTMAGIVPTLSNDQPSGSPSSAPSVIGEAAAAASSRTPPYVIAAIVLGSWAILMACCFSVFLCRKNRKESDEEQLLHNGRPSEESTPPLRGANKENGSQDLSTLPIVPNVVLADDDHRSLANTTLGEQTAGRKPPKKKRLVDTGISISSFEDESLYTTPIGIIPRIQPGRRIDEDENDEKKRKSTASPPMLAVSSAYETEIYFPSDTGSSSQESWSMPQSPVASKIGGLIAAELGPVAGDHPEALPSEQGSQYTESRDDLDGMNGDSPWLTQQLSPRSSQSSLFSSLHSSDTLKAQNVVAAVDLTTNQKTSEEQHTVDAPGTYARSGSSSLLTRKKFDDNSFSQEKDATIKTPMKLLETHKEESAAAVMEEQSPMQMLEEEDNKTDVSPIDLQDSDSANDLHPSSSGERPPRTRNHPWQTGTAPRTPTDTPTEGHMGRRSVSPYKTRYLEGLHSPDAQRELEQTLSSGSQRTPSPLAKDTRREPIAFPRDTSSQPQTATPPFDLLPSMYNVKQGDGARQNAIESPPPVPLTEGDVSILTTSSSGTSADDNPWLFESVARALGPRSTSADMESLSGKSVKSTKSGKSWRSHRSAKSLGSRQRRKRRKGGSIGSRGSQRTSFSFGSPGDYKSSSDFSLAPRSLENDLKRLEQQLASLKSTDSKKQPDRVPPSPPGLTGASSSVTASDMSSHRNVSTKHKIIVVAPPGKLGVILANRHNGTGTVVSELRGSSPLRGALFPGDKLCKCIL